MQAILYDHKGNLFIDEVPDPILKENEVLVEVKATAVNRADLLQKRGKYPPPKGESDILGLEMAGIVIAKSPGIEKWKIGDRVCGLLAGGGYAQKVCIDQDVLMPIPEEWNFEMAAAMPEVFLTAYQALKWIGQLKTGEKLLIHAAASGVGTALIQLAKQMEVAHIWGTASKGKHPLINQLGIDTAIDYKSERFLDVILSQSDYKGANLIIDFIGANYFQDNIKALATEGRLVMLGLLSGARISEANLAPILTKRLQVKGSTLRSRSLEYKRALVNDFWSYSQQLFETNKIKVIIDSVYDWTEVEKAHERMAYNENSGKMVLRIK
ncbi:MAG: NAD(P)H-quinone oxidoreductase [Bacteroidota bacterium]